MDKFMGIPKEGFGFSGNPRVKFSPPKFEDCLFIIEKPFQQITIDIRYIVCRAITKQKFICINILVYIKYGLPGDINILHIDCYQVEIVRLYVWDYYQIVKINRVQSIIGQNGHNFIRVLCHDWNFIDICVPINLEIGNRHFFEGMWSCRQLFG